MKQNDIVFDTRLPKSIGIGAGYDNVDDACESSHFGKSQYSHYQQSPYPARLADTTIGASCLVGKAGKTDISDQAANGVTC
jgi:hypothetical protein